MNDCVLRTKSISKKYKNKYALKNVSINIMRGQIYGIIGLNGAGKTTLMRAILGLISLNSGDIELFGVSEVKQLEKCRRRIGQCIETPAIDPNLTAEQNLNVQRIIAGVDDKNAISLAMKKVGLYDVGFKKAKDFSYGMKQRLSLATALITNPEFLILDEPANGLDPKGIIELRSFILRENQENGTTFLISSHILDELSLIATHYGFIDKGIVIKQISAKELEVHLRQRIKIETNNAESALYLLKKHFAIQNFDMISKNEIWVNEKIDQIAQINALLISNGITVNSIMIVNMRLEDYFVASIERDVP